MYERTVTAAGPLDQIRGSQTLKTVPTFSPGRASMRPSCFCTMPWLMNKPSPNPSDLVVWKGSNRCFPDLVRQAPPRIGKANPHPLRLDRSLKADAQLPAFGHGVDGIQHQVEKHLL